MSASKEHPDLLALIEGRLQPDERQAAQRHLENCHECRGELMELRQATEMITSTAEQVVLAFPDPEDRARKVRDCLGPIPGEGDFLELERSELVGSLPPELAGRLAPASGGGGVAERLIKSIQAITGKGREAAQALAESILSAGMEPGAASAIRDRATDEDDTTDTCQEQRSFDINDGDEKPGTE